MITNQAQRAATIVKNLLTFGRKHSPQKENINVNSAIEKILELRAYEHEVHNIDIIKNLSQNLPSIEGDFFQLQQVFLNIIINAEHFMIEARNSGTLSISTETTNGSVKISFTDNGTGIKEDDLAHIFDPFFTTKEVGQGTGLGLSICHGIISEHGGNIQVISKYGQGSTFIVKLPIKERL
jgi:signal transduction histidine kinase